MKKYLYIIVFAVTSLLVISCDKNDGAYYPVPSDFSVAYDNLSISKEGGVVELDINAGNLGWIIESSETWCAASRKFGSGDAKVILTVAENNSGGSRSTEISVKPTFNQTPVKFIVSQE